MHQYIPFSSAKVCCWVRNVFNLSNFHQYLKIYMTSSCKQRSSVNPDLRLNRIKSSVKSNAD